MDFEMHTYRWENSVMGMNVDLNSGTESNMEVKAFK